MCSGNDHACVMAGSTTVHKSIWMFLSALMDYLQILWICFINYNIYIYIIIYIYTYLGICIYAYIIFDNCVCIYILN